LSCGFDEGFTVSEVGGGGALPKPPDEPSLPEVDPLRVLSFFVADGATAGMVGAVDVADNDGRGAAAGMLGALDASDEGGGGPKVEGGGATTS
jgi:hypothetical protein